MSIGILRLLPHYSYAYYLYAKHRTKVGLRIEDAESDEGDGLPLPPVTLRYRVHGSAKPNSFLHVGKHCAQDIITILSNSGYDFSRFDKVLDFGCGCGRVMRFLPWGDQDPRRRLYGTDNDAQAIRWCKRNLPFAEWSINGDLPPLKFEPDSFDFVSAISVFTHLDERFQNEWLKEIQRVLRPGGLLLATVHGNPYIDALPQARVDEIRRNGILNTAATAGPLKLDGLPDYYQTTYHLRDYIEKTWSEIFEIVAYKARGMNKSQDAILLRKRDQALGISGSSS